MDLNETMHAMPVSTINHENNVLVLLLVHRGAVIAGVISSGNAWERRSQSYFDSGNGVPRNGVPRNEIVR